jgi:hypothetical protein
MVEEHHHFLKLFSTTGGMGQWILLEPLSNAYPFWAGCQKGFCLMCIRENGTTKINRQPLRPQYVGVPCPRRLPRARVHLVNREINPLRKQRNG